jgi:ABC-type molybdate transport system substrate-binding protein
MKSFLLAAIIVTLVCSLPSAAATTYSIGGTVSGLTSGTVKLEDNGGNALSITANGTFTFTTKLATGKTYDVTVSSQPSGQTCTPSANTGTVGTQNVTTVVVTCAATQMYSIGGTISGLTGTVKLENNGGNVLSVTANGTFTFTTKLASGKTYDVTVSTQPSGQTCTPTDNTGTVGSENVTTVIVTCVTNPTYSIGGTISGLIGTVHLEDNGGNALTVTANGTFTFTTKLATGKTYDVTVSSQPASAICTPSDNTGTVGSENVTTVVVTCVPSYSIGGTVSGLTGTGLQLQNNGGNTLSVTKNGTFTFSTKLVGGSAYDVTVSTQPTGQTCTPSKNTGTVGSSNVTTVVITCTSPTYSIGGTVSGLTGTGLQLQDNGGNTLSVTANGSFTFSTQLPSGSTYDVTVFTQPTGQTCTPSDNTGTVGSSNVTSVVITCTASASYSIGGTVSGLTGTGLQLQDNGGNTLSVTANGSFTFSTKLPSGSTYDVTVSSQPTGQTCTPTDNTGTVGSSNVTSVVVTCSSATYTISVAVTGLTGSVELQDDQGATLTFSSNDTQTFSNTYASGAAYTISITSQPLTVSCIPTYATGTITANITIFASCTDGATRSLGTVSAVSTTTCPGGGVANGVCQQMTVSCPDVPSVSAYVKTNTPTGTPLGVASYGTGTEGNGLYESAGIFTYGQTAVQNVLDAGFITVQISWGTPFNNNQPNGWVQGPGGVLAASCRYATLLQWIQQNIGTSTPNLPQCATGNSGGAGALAYVLSQYPNTLSMAEVTSGPPTGRLDWGCGCTEGKLAVQCGDATTLGTCFGKTDGAVWDGAYSPNSLCSTAAGGGALPPGGLNFFLGDSAEAPGATYNFATTYVNLVFGGQDGSSAIPIGQDWFNHVTSSKAQVCVADAPHSIPDVLDGATQIANDLISLCKLQ